MNNNCLICQRIEAIKKGENPYFVTELEACYVVLGDSQFYKGYTLLLAKDHKAELNLLRKDTQKKLMEELILVGEAIYKLFNPKKLNYELLGNEHSHVHWHIFPRYKDDPNPKMPVWVIEEKVRNSVNPSLKDLNDLKARLLNQINLGNNR